MMVPYLQLARTVLQFLILVLLIIALAACGDTKRIAEQLPTPPERLVCERAGTAVSIGSVTLDNPNH